MIGGGAFPINPLKSASINNDNDHFKQISKEQILSARISFINHSPGRIPKIRSKMRVEEDNTDLPAKLSPLLKEVYLQLLSVLSASLPSRKAEVLLFVEKQRAVKDDKTILLLIAKIILLADCERLNKLDCLNGDTDIYFGNIVREMKNEFGHLPELELRTHLSRAFATLLVTSTGHINFGIIPEMMPIFRHFEKSSDFACSFENALDMLYTQTALREKIESLKKPSKELTNVRELIRVTLGLNRKRVGSVDAKRTLVTALLSYPKQENVGNCFAISLAISLFSNSIMKCVDDFVEILSYGCLKRFVENEQVSFPFLMKMPIEHSKKALPPNFKEDPFFKSLKDHLNIDKWPDGKATTVEELLKLADKQKPGSLEKGRFFVEAKTKNPLITVWGNILASMAEGGSETLLKTALTGSLLHIASSHTQEPVLNELKKSILDRIHIHYDPEIESAGDTNGAFVLYDKTRDWKRIDDPTKFHHFILHAISNPDLKTHFKKKKLMKELLKVYHPDNSTADKSYKEMTDLPYTPWVTKIGNDPKQLLKIYKGATQTELTVLFHPHQATDLLEMVLKTSKNYFDKRRDATKRRSSLMMPVRIVGQHTFNLIINHPSLTKWLINPDKMHETLLAPAKKINSEPYDSTEILKYFSGKGSFILKDPPLLLKDLRALLLKKFPQDLVDKKLFFYLKPEQKKAIQETAIQFASTNWQREADGKALHLAFAYNPASLNLEVFEALDDDQKTLVAPVDQDSQIKNALWEFYKDPVL